MINKLLADPLLIAIFAAVALFVYRLVTVPEDTDRLIAVALVE